MLKQRTSYQSMTSMLKDVKRHKKGVSQYKAVLTVYMPDLPPSKYFLCINHTRKVNNNDIFRGRIWGQLASFFCFFLLSNLSIVGCNI
jgi:hypothetical protein